MTARTKLASLASAFHTGASATGSRFSRALGGAERTRVILVLAGVLGLSGADTSTVGASATELRHALAIDNTDIGLLVSVTSLVAAVGSLPFGVLADRVRRTWVLGASVVFWGAAMIWSATAGTFGELLLARVFLGGVTAAAGPLVASLVGDYFPAAERGRIYGIVLAGELAGTGIGFVVTGDIATLSWRAAFVILALPAFALAWLALRLPEPGRGGAAFLAREGADGDGGAGGGARPRRTDAQRLARERGVAADPGLVLRRGRLGFVAATRYVLRVRTNVTLIAASALGYYFLAGVQTFGLEFAENQYRVDQGLANLILLALGAGAVVGVLAGGAVGDALIGRGYLTGRVLASALFGAASVALFVPALVTRDALTALPYLVVAAFALAGQNPPLDAARLDIMPPRLWGRAEAIRTLLRGLARALAPLLFGAISEYVFGGHRTGLQWTFVVMLLPLAVSAVLLFRARRTYPGDVATAAAGARA